MYRTFFLLHNFGSLILSLIKIYIRLWYLKKYNITIIISKKQLLFMIIVINVNIILFYYIILYFKCTYINIYILYNQFMAKNILLYTF